MFPIPPKNRFTQGKQAERNVTNDLHASIAAEITLSWFLLPFVRACFEFLTTLTFRALHGNRNVSTPFQTIVEEDNSKKNKKSSPTCPSTPDLP